MPDLLIELRSEEIPARMQRKAAGDLKRLVTDGLVEAGLTYEGAREYWTPRRLTLDVRGVDAASKDTAEERKGPRTDASAKAIEGFLRGAGLASLDAAEVRTEPKKGDFYVAMIRKAGRPAEAIIAELMPTIVTEFPWPKSMRWGKASRQPGSLRWVRPLQSILCTFGPETSEPVVVDFEVGGIRSGNLTFGHRFHAPAAIKVRRFDDYAASLERAFVVLDAERRKDIIRTDADNLAFANGLEIVPDEALLEEVAGLVEWPVVLMGAFEETFLAIPPEVVRLTIKTNQKCFVTRIAGAAALSNRFVLVSNIEASDGGSEIARGNGKVVRARLSDALYFWNTDQADLPDLEGLHASAEKLRLDLKKPLDQRMAKLDALGVTFHAKLGTQGERVRRIARLAEEIAPMVGADPALARRAALLAKADLTSEAVGEFPELQGLMGRYYAALQSEHPSVQAAIEEHYRPQGPGDAVPTDPVAIAVALADRLDTLVGFWAIDEKPTGSKDPYALRRAALGVIRIVLENNIAVNLSELIGSAHHAVMKPFFEDDAVTDSQQEKIYTYEEYIDRDNKGLKFDIRHSSARAFHNMLEFNSTAGIWFLSGFNAKKWLLDFFHDRLKGQLRDQGARHDLVDAVLSGEAAGPSSGPSGHLLPQGEKYGVADVAESGAIPRRYGERMSVSDSEATEEGARASGSTETRESASRQLTLNDDLLDITRRVEALGAFLSSEDGTNLLAGARRAENILAAEEKKGTSVAASVDPALLVEPEERALLTAVDAAETAVELALGREDYAAAMSSLASLRWPVDAFFEAVLVNADDAAMRGNRLALLGRVRTATRTVADFSKIAG